MSGRNPARLVCMCRCKTPDEESPLRTSGCSNHSLPPRRMEWEWAFPSAVPSSMPTAAGCGRLRDAHAERYSNSCSQRPHIMNARHSPGKANGDRGGVMHRSTAEGRSSGDKDHISHVAQRQRDTELQAMVFVVDDDPSMRDAIKTL